MWTQWLSCGAVFVLQRYRSLVVVVGPFPSSSMLYYRPYCSYCCCVSCFFLHHIFPPLLLLLLLLLVCCSCVSFFFLRFSIVVIPEDDGLRIGTRSGNLVRTDLIERMWNQEHYYYAPLPSTTVPFPFWLLPFFVCCFFCFSACMERHFQLFIFLISSVPP